jgi:hypothetical protein
MQNPRAQIAALPIHQDGVSVGVLIGLRLALAAFHRWTAIMRSYTILHENSDSLIGWIDQEPVRPSTIGGLSRPAE